MFTTQLWGSMAVLLCTLLLQSCQLHSVRATEEEGPTVGSSSASAVCQRASSESPAMRSLTFYSSLLASHAPPSRFSTTPVHRQNLSAALSTRATIGNALAAPYDLSAVVMPRFSRSLGPSAPSTSTIVGNSLVEPCDLPTTAMLTASRVEPSGDESGHARSPDDLWVELDRKIE
jgi:hypothetical protein